MTIAEQLTDLNNIKQALKTLLSGRSIISGSDAFAAYAGKIQSLLTIGSQKTCNISTNYAYNTLGSPVVLPSAEPTNPQISYTVQSGYFPTLTGDLPASIDYVGFIKVGLKNNIASAKTLNWKVFRNGNLINNGSSAVASSNTFGLSLDMFSGSNKPVAGDVITIKLWCSEDATSLQIDKHVLGIVPTRFKPVNNSNKLLTNLSVSQGNTLTGYTNYLYVYYPPEYLIYSCAGNNFSAPAGISNITFCDEDATYGVLSSNIDIVNQVYGIGYTGSSVYRVIPVYYPTSVSWKETNIINSVNLL